MWKRECKNANPDEDGCETYVTPFQTTGIPLIIGLSSVELPCLQTELMLMSWTAYLPFSLWSCSSL